MRVPIDAIAGTSMGAVVGGLYASGLSAVEIEKLISSVNWQDAFQDRPPRAELGFRRKQDDREFPRPLRAGPDRRRLRAAARPRPGTEAGAGAAQRRAARRGHQDFDRLPIPFRAVATDLETGEAVVMDPAIWSRRCARACPRRACSRRRSATAGCSSTAAWSRTCRSISARAMGVDVLIVVDVSFPLYAREELASPIEVTNQAFAILIRGRTLRAARETDVRPTSSSIRRSAAFLPPTSVACRKRCAPARRRARACATALAALVAR